jgi:hypothetical protein
MNRSFFIGVAAYIILTTCLINEMMLNQRLMRDFHRLYVANRSLQDSTDKLLDADHKLKSVDDQLELACGHIDFKPH